MQNQSKTKHISKGNHHNPHKTKKPYRPQFNNNNPNNKLALNKYHQIQSNPNQSANKSDSNKLHKRRRDLQRIIKHCQQKGIKVDPVKMQELEKIRSDMDSRRKTYEKGKRKQFFLEQKYKDIKNIELRKVYKHLGATKANTQMTDEEKRKEIEQWEKKLRYIKHFPKTLKYISLFPTSKPLEEKTLEFQQKIMAEIEEENSKRVARLNFYKSENQVSNKKGKKQQNDDVETQNNKKESSILPLTTYEIKTKTGKKHTRQVVDDFFVQQDQSNEQIQPAQQPKSKQEDENQSSSQQSELDEQVQIGDQDEMDEQDEDSQQDDDE